jgi:hypothetical protein
VSICGIVCSIRRASGLIADRRTRRGTSGGQGLDFHEGRQLIEQRSSITVPVEAPGTPESVAAAATPASISSRVLTAVRTATIEQKFIALLLILFVAKGVIVTFVHIPFSGHDEVMHYAYLEYVAESHRVPVLPDLIEWREARDATGQDTHDKAPESLWPYCRYTTQDWNISCEKYDSPNWAASMGQDFFPMGWVYTANHPPLYFLIMTPVYWMTDGMSIEGQLYALRLAALPFGLLTVLFAFLTVRTLFPRDRFLAMTVPAFVAFQPQISYEGAMLNNDILAIAFTSIVIYLLARGLKARFPIGTVALIGFFYGLAILSKNTSLTTGGIIAFAMILGLGIRNWREWMAKGAIAAGITGLMVWPWYVFMYRTYGDFTALSRIRELQYWNYGGNINHPTIWDQLADEEFFWLRWRETWGEFGWRLIRLDDSLLRLLMWVSIGATIGIAVWAVRLYLTGHEIAGAKDEEEAAAIAARSESVFALERWQVVGVLTMGVTCIVAYVAILQFGTTFSLTQARYYFPAIVPAAILFMLGLRAIIPRRWLSYGQLGVFVSLVMLTVVIYSAYVLPHQANHGKTTEQINPFYK